MQRHRSKGMRRTIASAAVVGIALVAAACGGGGGDKGSGSGGGDASAGKPVKGGTLSYGLEAETSGGWCLAEGQLAISGIQVARSIYDTLTAPDADGKYKPFLAESVTPNANFTQWNVKLRSGVKFSDGSPLTSQVVKNNLDAYRGKYPARKPLLFIFVLDNIKDVTVVDPLTVSITTKTPWPSLPAFLHSSGRMGMMGQKQLDDPKTCDRNLIGTGPFKLQDWKVNDRLTVVRNPNYWQKDADGNQLPYLDSIVFRPLPDADARLSALQSGEINAMHTSSPQVIDELRTAKEQGSLDAFESNKYTEVAYGMMNIGRLPFSNRNARLAMAYGLNRKAYEQAINLGALEPASGPFAPGETGYLADAGFPKYDPAKAREYIKKFQAETGKPLEFTIISTPDPGVQQSVQYLQAQAKKFGAKVNLATREQAALITQAISGNFDILSWRNHPGGDPDLQYVWWKGGNLTNFSKINDPEINRLLDEGRANPDPAARKTIYESLNRRFASEVYNLWLDWSPWTIGHETGVQGILGPNLPDGSKPFPGLATGHPLEGMWIKK